MPQETGCFSFTPESMSRNPDIQHEGMTLDDVFILFSSVCFVLAWIGLILTEFRVFYTPVLTVCLAGLVVAVSMIIFGNGIRRWSFFDISVMAGIGGIGLLNALLAHETILERDYGVFSTAAVYLARAHSLIIPLGNDLSFLPGWVSTGSYLTTEFHYGYTVWVAIHYALLGMRGLFFSNFIPIMIGLASLYFIGKLIANRLAGLISVILMSTTYAFFWFSRRTLTETFSLALMWFSVYCSLKAFRFRSVSYLFPAVVALGYFTHVRFEALPIFGLYCLFLLALALIRKYRWLLDGRLIAFGSLIVVHIAYYFLFVQRAYGGMFLPAIQELINQFKIVPGVGKAARVMDVQPVPRITQSALFYHMPDFVYRVLTQYNVYIFIFLAGFYLIHILANRKQLRDHVFIFLLVLPTCLYLFTPKIYVDQPWMLRRYYFSIIPCAILFGTALLFSVAGRRATTLVLGLLLIINLAVSAPVIPFKEYDGVYRQIREFASEVPDDGLVYVNQWVLDAHGQGLILPLYFLFGKQARVLTPPDYAEISTRIRDSGSRHVYVLTNDSQLWYNKSLRDTFGPDLSEVASYSLAFPSLVKQCNLLKGEDAEAWVRMDYKNYVLPFCFDPTIVSSEIIHNTYLLKLYKIK